MTLSENPRDWSADQVTEFADSADPGTVEGVLRRLLSTPDDDQAVSVIVEFLGARHGHTMLKPVPSQLATRALLSLGPTGVETLATALVNGDANVRYRASVLRALWQVGRGSGIVATKTRDSGGLLDLELPPGTQEAAERAIRDIFAEALVNPDVLWVTARLLQEESFMPGDDSATELIGLFAEASIKLSRSVLDDFQALLGRSEREEVYQQFLAKHPVLIDPLAAEVVPKQRLGLELATDFAVRSHEDRWLLVEIERPQDELFTKAGDFRERLVHAFGQVIDFQHWVDDNVAYAQKHMPGITGPRGLVVIGTRQGLSERERAKLRHFAENSRRIDVVTFDDLLARSRSLYENLWHRD